MIQNAGQRTRTWALRPWPVPQELTAETVTAHTAERAGPVKVWLRVVARAVQVLVR